ncbi:hypothetical protein [Methylomonas sp.]|nr:hypothetical protein [Methylomonas sp.]
MLEASTAHYCALKVQQTGVAGIFFRNRCTPCPKEYADRNNRYAFE